MKNKLHYNTVSALLKSALHKLMKANEFEQFRLVGGTSLSLQFGHRLSVDIDLFTDAVYGSVDFKKLTKFLKDNFAYVSTSKHELIGMGTSYLIGNNENDCVKLDVYYTELLLSKCWLLMELEWPLQKRLLQ